MQFAHYLGYFLMALPGLAGQRFGWKGGIVAGLLLVLWAASGFWKRHNLPKFWAFLLGVCVIASGLTFLEAVANPYTTILGNRRSSHPQLDTTPQSCNGIGWTLLGLVAGSLYFYSVDTQPRARRARPCIFHTWASQSLSSSSLPFSLLPTFPTSRPKTKLVAWKSRMPRLSKRRHPKGK